MKETKDNKITQSAEILKQKIKEKELELLKKKAKKIDEDHKSSKKRKRGKRKILQIVLVVAIILIILIIFSLNMFIDTEEKVINEEYEDNLKNLQSELNKIIKEKSKSDDNFNMKHLDSRVTLQSGENDVEYIISDVLDEYKNEYTKESIAIYDGKLIYMGSNESFQNIATKNNIETNYIYLTSAFSSLDYFDFNEETGSIELYKGESEIVYVPTYINGIKVKEIADFAFENTDVSVIIFSEGITQIGKSSFANNQIFYLKLPSTLEYIGDKAFYKNNLTEISIQKNVKNVGSFAFASNKLEKIEILEATTNLGAGCFNQNYVKENEAYFYKQLADNEKYELVTYAGNSTSVKIPEGVVKIGESAFSKTKIGNNNEYKFIKDVNLPNSLKIIDNEAFENNDIVSLNIPNSVEYIGRNAFRNNKITDLKLNNMDDMYLMKGCFNNNFISGNDAYIITNKILNNSVSKIDYYNGALVYSLSDESLVEEEILLEKQTIDKRTFVSYAGKDRNKIVVPYSVVRIEDLACANLGIKEVNFSESVIEIGMKSFAGNKLQMVEIPANVMEIDYNAFLANEISEIIILGKNEMPEGFDSSLISATDNIIYK